MVKSNKFLPAYSFKTLFMIFIAFAVLYNSYRYFIPWGYGNKPLVPLYISIVKDIPWAIVVVVGIVIYLRHNKQIIISDYRSWDGFRKMSVFFMAVHILLLVVGLIHLTHKNLVDVLQRDIKNVQYIFLPALFPLLLKREKDLMDYINWLVYLGISVSVFGFLTYFLIPRFTWDGAALSTFQSPINYGFFTAALSLIVMSKILVEKNISWRWHVALWILYGALLTSVSLSALLSLITGFVFMVIVAKPRLKIISKIITSMAVASFLFYILGIFSPYLDKVNRSRSAYEATSFEYTVKSNTSENERNNGSGRLSWNILTQPHFPVSDESYQSKSRYTTITGRLISVKELVNYMESAPLKDQLMGDFSLRNYIEYDNVYFYFLRNDGIIVTFVLIVLLTTGFITGLRKFYIFLRSGNDKMAGVSLGITAFLLTSTVIQFNLSYYLTIYPLNFLTYFLLISIFYINPPNTGNSNYNKNYSND